MDNLDRLAYIVNIDKTNRTVVVKVAYQIPKSLAASIVEENSSISSSAKVDWSTHLDLESAAFDKIRPYKGEQVPRDVWLAICECLFSGGLSPMKREPSLVSDISLPVASSTLSSMDPVKPKRTLKSLSADVTSPEANANEDANASGGPTGPAPSIGGVGWGAFGPARMTMPLKNMISTSAGAAVDLVGGLASSVAIVSNGAGGSSTTATAVGSDARSASHASGSEKARDWMNSLGGRRAESMSQSSVWPNKHLVEQPTMDPRRADDSTTASSGLREPRTADEGINQCLLCDKTFPRDVSPEVFNSHMEEHYGPSCPFCNLRFPKTKVGERDLNNHVNAHLAEMGDM
ncbi:uncharacterized protein LOC142342460 [Convolutriloba macropyga]|uniref:uncharacterized protein LOC142342460 n=1 Tax=Convolutriloba macropyga TaxID=536237 RepID=UPI003F51D485